MSSLENDPANILITLCKTCTKTVYKPGVTFLNISYMTTKLEECLFPFVSSWSNLSS